jgi:hypothetical protein
MMVRIAVAVISGLIIISASATEKKSASPFDIKDFRLGMSQKAVVARFDDRLKCEPLTDNAADEKCSISFILGGAEPGNSDVRTVADQYVMNYSFYFMGEKLGQMSIWFNSFNTEYIPTADYRTIRNALAIKFGKFKTSTTKFIHRKADDESWEIALWRRGSQTVKLDENILNQGIIALELTDDAYSKRAKQFLDAKTLKGAKDI